MDCLFSYTREKRGEGNVTPVTLGEGDDGDEDDDLDRDTHDFLATLRQSSKSHISFQIQCRLEGLQEEGLGCLHSSLLLHHLKCGQIWLSRLDTSGLSRSSLVPVVDVDVGFLFGPYLCHIIALFL